MADRIEPPILMSRLMTFVFAASVVMAAVLFITLYNMFPLNRPQIFFLFSQLRGEREIVCVPLTAKDANYDYFVRGFLREYVKARNEIVPNVADMRKKWNNDSNSVMHAWSSPEVYEQLQTTNMWRAFMNDSPDFEFSCPVEFEKGAVKEYGKTKDKNGKEFVTYEVTFSYFCTDADNNRQVSKKNYTIRITLGTADKMKWQDSLTNPLGIYVSDYSVTSGNGDPLNTGYMED